MLTLIVYIGGKIEWFTNLPTGSCWNKMLPYLQYALYLIMQTALAHEVNDVATDVSRK